MAYSYKLIKHIATLSETQYGSKQVNIISHNNANPKMDIRNWEKNGKMTVRGLTLDAQEWEALGDCFSSSLKENNCAEIIDNVSWITKKSTNKYEINLVDFDIDIECETELIIEEQCMISYSIVFQTDKCKVQKYIEFLNNANKYFSEKGIFANAFIDFNDDIEFVKIIGNIPSQYELTEKQIDAFEEFLTNYADSINEIGGLRATQIRFEDIIVIGDRHACIHENHNKEELIVMVDFMSMDGNIFRVEAKASYCRECNLYFMRRHDYQMMKNRGRYSLMLCQEITEEKYLKNPSALQVELNDQSILHKYGYNVSDDMSNTQRQGILTNIIDRKILSKDRIASYLAYFIRLNKNKEKDFSKAIDKWNQDREFVLGYNTDIRKKIEPKKITVIKYKI